MGDYPDWQTPAAAAAQIAAAGVPLLAKSTQLLNLPGEAIAAAGSYNSAFLPVTQTGYEIVIATATAGAPTVPFCGVYLFWRDSVTGASIDVEAFIIPVTTGVATITVATSGPSRADQLSVKITNQDPAVPCTAYMTMLENSRTYSKADYHWVNYWAAGAVVPGYTMPGRAADNTVLGFVSDAPVPANSTITWLAGMGSGRPTVLSVNLGGASLASTLVNVLPQPSSVFGSAPVMVPSVPPADDFNIEFIAPRAPLAVSVVNNAATPITVSWSAVQQQ